MWVYYEGWVLDLLWAPCGISKKTFCLFVFSFIFIFDEVPKIDFGILYFGGMISEIFDMKGLTQEWDRGVFWRFVGRCVGLAELCFIWAHLKFFRQLTTLCKPPVGIMSKLLTHFWLGLF